MKVGKVVDEAGNTFYYNEKGQYHRIDGPAVYYIEGYKVWWVNGKIHRLDGPAVEYPDGTVAYWVDNRYLTLEEFEQKVTPLYKILYG